MSTPVAAPDRRSALKEKHHDALVQAAIALLADTRGERFSVEDLAERAGVSRRTVFNHFASLDEVLTQAGSTVLGPILEDLLHTANRRMGAAPEDSMVEDLTSFLASTDLVTPLAYLARILGGSVPEEPWRVALMHQSLARVAESIGAMMTQRYPDVEPVRIDLFVMSIAGGISTIHKHWIHATGGVDTPESRQVWDQLLAHFISTVRHGHAHHLPRHEG